MIVVGHAVPREKHVVCIEVAARREIRVAMELDAFAQLEGVGLAIGRKTVRDYRVMLVVPRTNSSRLNIAPRPSGWCRREELRLESLGTAFRAEHEVAFRCRAER
jgi:hypothetical protein